MGWFSTGAAGSILGAGLGAIGSVAGGLIQQNQNKKMMREQMAWNTSERQAAQGFTKSEREAQQRYQTSERNAQNDWSEMMYQNYQSPEALRAQYSAAGLDPALAISGNAAPAASSGSSGGAPTGAGAPTMGVTPPYQNMNAFSQGFGQIADALASLAQAKKAGVETMRMEKFMEEELKGLKLSNISQELANSLQKVDLNVKQQTALKQAFAVLNDTNASWQKKMQELDNLKKVGLLTQKQVDTFDEKFKNEQENIKSQTDLNRSQITVNDSIKSLNRSSEVLNYSKNLSEAKQRELNDTIIGINKELKRIAADDAYISSNTRDNRLVLSDADVKAMRPYIEKLEAEAEKLKKDNNFKEYDEIMNTLSVLSGLGISSSLVAKSFPAARPRVGY